MVSSVKPRVSPDKMPKRGVCSVESPVSPDVSAFRSLSSVKPYVFPDETPTKPLPSVKHPCFPDIMWCGSEPPLDRNGNRSRITLRENVPPRHRHATPLQTICLHPKIATSSYGG